MTTALLTLAAYLLGAIPFGLLIGFAHRVDIRTQGSRNIGATNVGRVVSRKWGYTCLILDVLKGLIPAILAANLIAADQLDASILLQRLLVAIAAVLGHVFPIYLRFRGGKGVATTVGVALGTYPFFTVAMAGALIAYAIVRFTTGLVSLGSLTIAVVFPLALFLYTRFATDLDLTVTWPLQLTAILLALVIVLRHRSNIQRLLTGREATMRDKPEQS